MYLFASSSLCDCSADLGVEETGFFLLLGIAEKMKPGIFLTVAGNPAIVEEKLVLRFVLFIDLIIPD